MNIFRRNRLEERLVERRADAASNREGSSLAPRPADLTYVVSRHIV